eukprot:3940660-Rhodomonas_salina.3
MGHDEILWSTGSAGTKRHSASATHESTHWQHSEKARHHICAVDHHCHGFCRGRRIERKGRARTRVSGVLRRADGRKADVSSRSSDVLHPGNQIKSNQIKHKTTSDPHLSTNCTLSEALAVSVSCGKGKIRRDFKKQSRISAVTVIAAHPVAVVDMACES